MSRASLTLFFSCSIVLAYGVTAVQQTQPKKAEEQFKNIQSFKGFPAREIIPAMQFMSVSLGVDCQFCHTEKGFELDDVRAKTAARHMIEMTRDINAKSFGGRNQVTCFTCHGGHERPNGTPASFGASPRMRPDSTMTVDQVIARFRSALGPEEAVTRLKSVRLNGTATQNEDKPSAVTLDQATPGKFVVTRQTPKGAQILGYNGSETWASFTGFGTQKLEEPTSELVQRFGKAFRDPGSMPNYDSISVGKAAFGAKTDTVIRGNLSSRKERDLYYFDAKTGLLDRVAYFNATILGEMPEVYDYLDYKRVDGVFVPFTLVQHNHQGTLTLRFNHAQGNPPIADSEFNMPQQSPGK